MSNYRRRPAAYSPPPPPPPRPPPARQQNHFDYAQPQQQQQQQQHHHQQQQLPLLHNNILPPLPPHPHPPPLPPSLGASHGVWNNVAWSNNGQAFHNNPLPPQPPSGPPFSYNNGMFQSSSYYSNVNNVNTGMNNSGVVLFPVPPPPPPRHPQNGISTNSFQRSAGQQQQHPPPLPPRHWSNDDHVSSLAQPKMAPVPVSKPPLPRPQSRGSRDGIVPTTAPLPTPTSQSAAESHTKLNKAATVTGASLSTTLRSENKDGGGGDTTKNNTPPKKRSFADIAVDSNGKSDGPSLVPFTATLKQAAVDDSVEAMVPPKQAKASEPQVDSADNSRNSPKNEIATSSCRPNPQPTATATATTAAAPHIDLLRAKMKLKKALLEKQRALHSRATQAAAAAAVAATTSAPSSTNTSPASKLFPRMQMSSTLTGNIPPIAALKDGALDSMVISGLQTATHSDKVHFVKKSQWKTWSWETRPDGLQQDETNGSKRCGSTASNTTSGCDGDMSSFSTSPVPPNASSSGHASGSGAGTQPTAAAVHRKKQELEQKLQQAKDEQQRRLAAKEKKQLLTEIGQRKLELAEKARRLQEPVANGQSEAEASGEPSKSDAGDSTTLTAQDTAAQQQPCLDDSQFSDADDLYFTEDVSLPMSATKAEQVPAHLQLLPLSTSDTNLVVTQSADGEPTTSGESLAVETVSNKPTRAELLLRKKEAEHKREKVRYQSVAAKQERLLADQTKQVQQTNDHLKQATEKLDHAKTQLRLTRRIIVEETTRKVVLEELLVDNVSQLVRLRKQLHDSFPDDSVDVAAAGAAAAADSEMEESVDSTN